MSIFFEIEPEFRPALEAAGLADFDALMGARGGPPASAHRYRETVPVEIEVSGRARRFYLKRVFRIPSKHAVGQWFRLEQARSQPVLEWMMLGALTEAGIPAMRRVAVGERRVWGRPVSALLLVEAVEGEHTLENWLVPGFTRPPAAERASRRLAFECGRLIGRLHAAGFSWPDMQAKHIFAWPIDHVTRDDCWRFCLIDVERMVRGGLAAGREGAAGISDDSRRRDLRILHASLTPRSVERRWRRLFWSGYRTQCPVPPPRRALVSAAAMPRLPDDYEHPRAVPTARRKGMLVDARMAGLLDRAHLRGIGDVFALTDGCPLDKPGLSRHRRRLRLALENGDNRVHTIYLKRYDRPPPADQFRRWREAWASRSSAWREVKFIRRLHEIGVPTLRLVAFGEEVRGLWERRSFAMTAGIDGQSLERLLDEVRRGASSPPCWFDRCEIIRQLALSARLLHGQGLFHRDLYLSHVFVSRNRDGRIVVRLIDLARMIENPLRRRRWQIKDLAALDYSAGHDVVTRPDRLRFLYHYLDGKPDRAVLVRLMAQVAAKSARIGRHDARRRAVAAGARED